MGAIPYNEGVAGVSFRVWAPHAGSVHIAGSFNGWNIGSHALVPDVTGNTWSIDIPSAVVGDQYKYVINGVKWRTDPRALAHASGGFKNSVVCSALQPPEPFTRPAANEMIICELHVGTFHDSNPGDEASGTFSNAVSKLDHLVDMGVNAVCVMPIAEF
jgi:1,4-alpha-glucan branching enzyme